MNRKLRTLGLALVAALALSGIVAMAAHAETKIKSENVGNETLLDITNDTNTHGSLARLTFGNGARFVECTKIDFNGTIPPAGSATTIKGTAEFTECFSNALTTAPATVTHEKCDLELTAIAGTSIGQATGAGCANILVHVFESQKALEEKKSLCTFRIPQPQTVTTKTKILTAGKEGPSHALTVNLTESNQINVVNEGPGGLAVCGIASGALGKGHFSNSLIISGTSNKKESVGITLE